MTYLNNITETAFYRLRLNYGKLTWSKRMLPRFVVIGAMKAGTTSIFHYVQQHPEIVSGLRKEINFFDGGRKLHIDSYKKGERWYRAHFPLKNSNKDAITFDVTPQYLISEVAPARMFELLPEAKLIAIVRNPTQRAVSQYFHEFRKGRENLPIEQALKAEEQRLNVKVGDERYKHREFQQYHYAYKDNGLYFKHLTKFLKYYPKEQILVVSSEELFEHPTVEFRRIFNFLQIEVNFIPKDLNPRNVSSNKLAVDSSVIESLNTFYKDPNEELFNLVGRRFQW